MQLVGTAQVADMLGVSKQRVHQLLASGRFPRPVARLTAGLFWDRADIDRWIKANRPD